MRTHITFVLDASGSMATIRDDTIGGFNTFLADQRTEPGEASVTLYEFDTSVERIYQETAIENAPPLDEDTYTPGGQTALHDAIATAITETKRRLAKLPAGVRPANVIVVVLTDGKENASETPHDRVQTLVADHRDEHHWEFLFIGANQDAALTATSMGMAADNALEMTHNDEGTVAAYQATSESVRRARREGQTGGYTQEDRRRQANAEER